MEQVDCCAMLVRVYNGTTSSENWQFLKKTYGHPMT